MRNPKAGPRGRRRAPCMNTRSFFGGGARENGKGAGPVSSAPPWRLKATSLEAPATPAAQPTPPRHRQRWQRHRRRPPSRGGRRRRVVCSLPRVPEGRGRTFSAALARGGRRSPRHRRPAHEAPPGSWRSSGPLPLHLRRRRSRGGSEHVHLFIPLPLLLRRVGTPGQDSLKKISRS